MAEQQMVDPHDPVMTGENSFIRLSNDGGKTIAERISHWRVLWSPAGQGHALFIEAPCRKTASLFRQPRRRALPPAHHRGHAAQAVRRRVAAGHRRHLRARRRLAQHGVRALHLDEGRHPDAVVGPDAAVHPDHAAGRDGPAARRLQHLPAGEAARSSRSTAKRRRGKVFLQERGGSAASSCVLAWSESWTQPRNKSREEPTWQKATG